MSSAVSTAKMSTPSLFLRAVAAFVAMPLMVAFAVPWFLRPAGVPFRMIGLPVLIAGTVVLLACVRSFYVAGQGTLAPWSPPKHLVTVGLYRFSRNPMYVGVLLVLVGWALSFPSLALWIYAALIAVAFHLRVVLNEEPWLAQAHAEQWTRYRASAPRWFGWPNRSG